MVFSMQVPCFDAERLHGCQLLEPGAHSAAGTITTADLERYKQKLARGALTAGLNYYRAAIDSVTWNKPKPRCSPFCCGRQVSGLCARAPAEWSRVRTQLCSVRKATHAGGLDSRQSAVPAAAAVAAAPAGSTRDRTKLSTCCQTEHGDVRRNRLVVRRKQHPVDCPCLVLWADSDTKMGVQLLNGIEEVVARPEVHVLENSSHWLQQDKCVLDPLA